MPPLVIAFAVAAFVLAGNDALLTDLRESISASVPPGLLDTLNEVIIEAIESRAGVGILGLLGALYSGLGWMSNLREALAAQWEQPHEADSFARSPLIAVVVCSATRNVAKRTTKLD